MFSGNAAQITDAAYIEDVFSTWLYTGNGATQTINNGIDLAGKGGLVWMKQRSGTTANHALYDTARGATFDIASNLNTGQTTQSTGLTSFLSNGFSIGSLANINTNAATYASWTFREQPKFFDIVTYTGNGANQTISHALGSVPGCIMVKSTSTTGDWFVYHRGLTGGTGPNFKYLNLNTTGSVLTGSSQIWGSTATDFTLYSGYGLNTNGVTYVAYLFAHDAGGFGATGADNAISCGSSDGSETILGWEPQWLLYRSSDFTDNWHVIDNMRGAAINISGRGNWNELSTNLSNAETNIVGSPGNPDVRFTSRGFILGSIAGTAIYIAIRRGPMRTPTSGTSVFFPQTYSLNTGFWGPYTSNGRLNGVLGAPAASLNAIDWSLFKLSSGVEDWLGTTRLTGFSSTNTAISTSLSTNITAAESVKAGGVRGNAAAASTGLEIRPIASSVVSFPFYSFARAPGFFDVVCYTGNLVVGRGVNHNLGAVPELIIVKNRLSPRIWAVYSAAISNAEFLDLGSVNAKASGTTYWNSTTPNSSTFTVGNNVAVNNNGDTYVAYLFASCPGVSKVGSFTGTGATQVINCGFAAGARFVLIKRTDASEAWYVWDSARGIVAGNDPYLRLNSTDAEVTNTDWVDTAASGFELSNAAGNLVNASGGSYIFLAIA